MAELKTNGLRSRNLFCSIESGAKSWGYKWECIRSHSSVLILTFHSVYVHNLSDRKLTKGSIPIMQDEEHYLYSFRIAHTTWKLSLRRKQPWHTGSICFSCMWKHPGPCAHTKTVFSALANDNWGSFTYYHSLPIQTQTIFIRSQQNTQRDGSVFNTCYGIGLPLDDHCCCCLTMKSHVMLFVENSDGFSLFGVGHGDGNAVRSDLKVWTSQKCITLLRWSNRISEPCTDLFVMHCNMCYGLCVEHLCVEVDQWH